MQQRTSLLLDLFPRYGFYAARLDFMQAAPDFLFAMRPQPPDQPSRRGLKSDFQPARRDRLQAEPGPFAAVYELRESY